MTQTYSEYYFTKGGHKRCNRIIGTVEVFNEAIGAPESGKSNKG